MLVGEFPFQEAVKEGHLQRIWYLFYTFVVFFLAVNIFLAIIVEAFLEVKRRITEECVTENSILTDAIGLIRRAIWSYALRWPSTIRLARHLHTTRHFVGP